jgi:2-aminoadipate transaminase
MLEDGVDLQHLDQVLAGLKRDGLLPRVKMIYLVSYFQNPSGRTTSLAIKTALLEILKRYETSAGHPLYLLEDAAYRELRFTGEDVPSALTSGSDRVIYSGTYSKPFASGARVGFGLLPGALFPVVERIKGNHDFGTANLLQTLLAHVLATGRFESHLVRLRRRYARKARLMTRGMEEHFPPEVRWGTPKGGLYVWARMPRRVKTGVHSKLFQTALQKDVLYVPGALCYAEDSTRRRPNHEMRLSFGGATEADIREGIRRLGRIMRTAMS